MSKRKYEEAFDCHLDEEIYTESGKTLIGYHLDSPLLPSKVGFLKTVNWPYSQAYRKEKLEFDNFQAVTKIYNRCNYTHEFTPIWIAMMWNLSTCIKHKCELNATTQLAFGLDETIMQVTTSDVPEISGLVFKIENIKREIPSFVEEYNWLSVSRHVFEEAVVYTGSILSNNTPPAHMEHWTYVPGTQWITTNWNENITLYTRSYIMLAVHLDSNTVYVWSRNVMLLIADKLTERWILSYSTFIGHILQPLYYPPLYTVRNWLEKGDIILHHCGNDGYTILKHHEALCSGKLLSLEESDYLNTSEFMLSTLESVKNELNGKFVRIVSDWISTVTDLTNIHYISQYFGLYRIWGHPYVNVIKGLKKVMTIATTPKVVDVTVVHSIGHKFKEMFFIDYHKKNGMYPQFTYPEEYKETYLIARLLNNSTFNKNSTFYALEHWDLIEVSETFAIPATYNLSQLLSDKAITLGRYDLINNIKTCSSILDTTKRRAILAWLKSNYATPADLLRDIVNGKVPLDYLIIGLYPKEREMKTEPRLFALMSLTLRLYFTLTEQMLSDHVLTYLPAITMKDDLLELQKKMTETSRLTAKNLKIDTSVVTVVYNLDFNKWNLNMRGDAVNGLFKLLGQLFGSPKLYTMTHEIFEQSIIYLADGSYLPKVRGLEIVVDYIHSWIGHLGGFEGLRQKGWTIFTVILLSLVADTCNVKYRLMGQGDNQVMVVDYLVNKRLDRKAQIEDIKKKMDKFWQTLIEYTSAVGLPLKEIETWKSHSLFAYGKNLYFQGVPLCMSLKKGIRSFWLSNDATMTLDNSLSTISANVQTAAMSDILGIIPMMIQKTEGLIAVYSMSLYSPLCGKGLHQAMIDRRSQFSIKMPESGDKLTHTANDTTITFRKISKILNVPRVLGGYSTTNWLALHDRGFPDPLTLNLTHLKKMYQATSDTDFIAMMYPPLLPEVSMEMLIQDPTAINLILPTSGFGVINSEAENLFRDKSKITNPAFLEIADLLQKQNKDKIYEIIATMTPYWPKLAHDLLSATPVGFLMQAIHKISSTVTIRKLIIQTSEESIVLKLQKSEIDYYTSLFWRLGEYQTQDMPIPRCSREHAEELRRIGWKRKLYGITTPHPAEIFLPVKMSNISEYRQHYRGFISALFSRLIQPYNRNCLLKTGPYTGYLGSKTKNKAPHQEHTVESTEPLLKKLMKLFACSEWFILVKSNLYKMLNVIYNSVTNYKLTINYETDMDVSGSPDHRYQDEVTKHGGLLASSTQLATYTFITTDTLTEYSRGSKNVTLHFQASLCYTQMCSNYFIHEILSGSNDTESGLAMVLHCPHCIRPVDEEKPEIDDANYDEIFPIQDQTKAIWVEAEKLKDRKKKDHILSTIVQIPTAFLSDEQTHKLASRLIGTKMLTVKRNSEFNDNQIESRASKSIQLVWLYVVDPYDILIGCLRNIIISIHLRKITSGLMINPNQSYDDVAKEIQSLGYNDIKNLRLFNSDYKVWAKLLNRHTWIIKLDDMLTSNKDPHRINFYKQLLITILMKTDRKLILGSTELIFCSQSPDPINMQLIYYYIEAMLLTEPCSKCAYLIQELISPTMQNKTLSDLIDYITGHHLCKITIMQKWLYPKTSLGSLDGLVKKISIKEDIQYTPSRKVEIEKYTPWWTQILLKEKGSLIKHEEVQWRYTDRLNYTYWLKHLSLEDYIGFGLIDIIPTEFLNRSFKEFFVTNDKTGRLIDTLIYHYDDAQFMVAPFQPTESTYSGTIGLLYPSILAKYIGKQITWDEKYIACTQNMYSKQYYNYWSNHTHPVNSLHIVNLDDVDMLKLLVDAMQYYEAKYHIIIIDFIDLKKLNASYIEQILNHHPENKVYVYKINNNLIKVYIIIKTTSRSIIIQDCKTTAQMPDVRILNGTMVLKSLKQLPRYLKLRSDELFPAIFYYISEQPVKISTLFKLAHSYINHYHKIISKNKKEKDMIIIYHVIIQTCFQEKSIDFLEALYHEGSLNLVMETVSTPKGHRTIIKRTKDSSFVVEQIPELKSLVDTRVFTGDFTIDKPDKLSFIRDLFKLHE